MIQTTVEMAAEGYQTAAGTAIQGVPVAGQPALAQPYREAAAEQVSPGTSAFFEHREKRIEECVVELPSTWDCPALVIFPEYGTFCSVFNPLAHEVAVLFVSAETGYQALADRDPEGMARSFVMMNVDYGPPVLGAALGAAGSSRGASTTGGQCRGGKYGDLSTEGGQFARHHMPAKQASPLPPDQGPAIQMKPEHHRKTASYGGGPGSPQQAYRDRQKALIRQGKFEDAFLMDADDVLSKFGSEYEAAIVEAIDALP